MSVKITYFVHGTTGDNENKISSGWKDVPLSKLGIQQAKELALLTKDKTFDVVFCSDLIRAIDTAHYAWGERFKIIEDSRLREMSYGTYNGKKSNIVEPLQEQHVYNLFPDGESYEIVGRRINSFLDDLKQKYQDKHIAIVGHKAPQLALDVLLKKYSWEEAFKKDWRKKKEWQPGWEYEIQ